MDYKTALHRLLGLVDFERYLGSRGPRVKFNLARMAALLQSLDNPHLNTPTVHIAGTKGKGSTTAMVTSVLASQGYTTGMFISPHLHTFRERICVNGTPISEAEFSFLVGEVWPHLEKAGQEGEYGPPSLFETLTAMAFLHFCRLKTDFQVLEVGLGGRLDSTNLVRPNVCVITPISLDHTAILGDSVEQVALEKAGIVKPGVPVVSAPQPPEAQEVVRRVCEENSALLVEVGADIRWRQGLSSLDGQSFRVEGRLGSHRLRMPLLGDYQLENAATAVGALESLVEQGWNISTKAMVQGFNNVYWPCRMEVLQREPLVVADGAHNPYSMQRLCQALPKYFGFRRVVPVFGASRDKNLERMIEELAAMDPIVVATHSRHPRSAAASSLARTFASKGVEVYQADGVAEALEKARSIAGQADIILATGSLFVAAEVREVVLGLEPETYTEFHAAPTSPAAISR